MRCSVLAASSTSCRPRTLMLDSRERRRQLGNGGISFLVFLLWGGVQPKSVEGLGAAAAAAAASEPHQSLGEARRLQRGGYRK